MAAALPRTGQLEILVAGFVVGGSRRPERASSRLVQDALAAVQILQGVRGATTQHTPLESPLAQKALQMRQEVREGLTSEETQVLRRVPKTALKGIPVQTGVKHSHHYLNLQKALLG